MNKYVLAFLLTSTFLFNTPVFAKWGHISSPKPRESWFIDDELASVQPHTVDEMWIFSASADALLNDVNRPNLVVGGEGTWSINLTSINPFGSTMPFLGVAFSLQPGSTPCDTLTNDCAFFHTFGNVPNPNQLLITDYWHYSDTDQWLSASGTVSHEWNQPIPPQYTTSAEVAQYMWSNPDLWNTVPLPATAWLFGSGLLGLIGVARRKTA